MNELEQEKNILILLLLRRDQEWMTKDDDEDVEVIFIPKIDLDDDENYGLVRLI